jgi:hypothetical protein
MTTTETQRHGDSDGRDINEITGAIIGAAIAVHRVLGPGLLESIYEAALCVEFDERTISYARQQQVPAFTRGVASRHTSSISSSRTGSSSRSRASPKCCRSSKRSCSLTCGC